MARLIPPPPSNSAIDQRIWIDWFNLLWRRVKGLEPGETDGGDSNALHSNVASEIAGITPKSTPADADEFVIEDSADSYNKKALTWANVKSALNTYLGGLYLKLDASNDPITNPLEIQGAITATGVIENVNTTAKTSNYTVVATDDNILCDTSGGAFTVTLPASPENGRCYTIVLETGGYPLTVAGNGKNILGESTKTINYESTAIQLMYNGTQWSAR
jgi:hypothetical protein